MPYNSRGEWVSDSAAAQSPDIAGGDTGAQIASMDLLDVFGQRAQHQRHLDAVAEDRNRAYWDTLSGPTVDQLMGSPEGREAQTRALSQLEQWGRGGLTSADRGSLEATRQRDMQAARGAEASLQQQAQSRGIGGSGLDFAMRQQASQLGQQQASDAEAQMMQSAQQRALAAIGASADLGGQMRQQDAQAYQQQYQNEVTRSAGATGQYGTDTSNRQAANQRQQQNSAGILGLLGSLVG